jgi:P27 family predicted phage terminase small subunit
MEVLVPQNTVPTAIKILRGNPGHRPLPENEPTPELGAEMPEGLSSEAARHWPKISALLEDMGVLTNVDAQALALYCEVFARWRYACTQLARYGLVVKSPSGYPIQSPYLAIENRAQDQMVALMREFGMTPASRTKVSSVKPKQKENSFLRLMKTI